ncbi:MAG: hypothetical protein AAFR81_30510, partial [Chloroflexota bacterium]
FEGERLLVRRIVSGDKLNATKVSDVYICNTDVFTLKLKKTNGKFRLEFFLGIIGSLACAAHLKSQNVNLDRASFPKINTKTLKPFPVPKLDLDNPADKAKHDAVVAQVELMLAKQKELQQLENELDERRHEVVADIAHIDKKIDALVYELYDLTPEEIAIVEGR